ncbi:MAG: response regulator [Magnetococcales bacterium]|nr:response regulator [Magnetococcales bacterium]
MMEGIANKERLFSPLSFTLKPLILLLSLLIPFWSGTLWAVDKVVLQLRWDPGFQFAGYYAALWQGYYRQAGIEVEIRPGLKPGPLFVKATKEVAEGRAHFGIGAGDILTTRDKGAPLVVLAPIFQRSPVAFYINPHSGFQSLADLEKMRVHRHPKDLKDVELQAMLRAEGIDPSRVNGPGHHQLLSEKHFIKGEMDFIPGYVFSTPLRIKEAPFNPIILRPDNYGIAFYGDTLFTSNTLLQQNEGLVKRFLAASLEGWQYAMDHSVEISDRIAKTLPTIIQVNDPVTFNRNQISSIRELTLYPSIKLGHVNPDRWRKMNTHLRHAGLVEKDVDTAKLVYQPQLRKEQAQEKKNRLIEIVVLIAVGLLGLSLFWGTILLRQIQVRRSSEAALRQAQQEAERANRYKSEFLANMSHEIRTPMNAIVSLSELAQQQDVSPKTKDYLIKINSASQSLLRIINDILDFSKIEAGKLALEEEDFLLRDVFDHLADLFRAQASRKHIELIICASEGCRYKLHGDSLRLEQVLLNIVSNAIKFTDEGEVEVQVQTIQDSSSQVTLEFSIRDTGIGMSEAQIDKLFKAFSQADNSTTRKFGGTGLGLSICHRLVEMMSGKIWVDSKPGQGSRFYFTAVFKRRLRDEEEEMVTPEEMEHLRALVVDDNFSANKALQRMLEMFSFTATGVGSGPEALSAIETAINENRPYQLLLVDWFMPSMNGIQTIHQIKENLSNHTPPKALLLTPFDRDEELKVQGKSWGVDGTICKPINCSFLFDTIMDIFGKDVTKAFRIKQDSIDPELIFKQIGGARILLVEDNAINRQVAQEILEGVGLVLGLAFDGLEAIERVKQSEYDLVLMDIQMPKMDGLEATREIRRDPRFQELPIVAMTAHAMTGDREKSLASGMNDHIAKPIDRKKLYSSLIKWIQPRQGIGGNALPETAPQQNENLSSELPDTLPGIEIKEALDRVNDNHLLLCSLFTEFRQDYSTAAQTIRQLFSSQSQEDLTKASQLTHTIKGMAGNISAKRLFDAALLLERELRDPPTTQLRFIDEFEGALNQVVTSISALNRQAEAPTKAIPSQGEAIPLDREKLIPLIHQLSVQVQENRFEAQETFHTLKPLLAGGSDEITALVAPLEEQIERIDFDTARTTLSTLSKLLEIDREKVIL